MSTHPGRSIAALLVYFTAWEEDGALRSVADVYGLDRRHDAAKGQ
jgi:murein L,D-transpeptidase YcbB/YkuD